MTAESAFLGAIADFLGAANLAPAPASIGVAEPDGVAAMPAIVLSLEHTARSGAGLGERSAYMTGALPWTVSIDLTNPVLPGDATVVLLDAERKQLILPHGGLVKRDGTEGPLTGDDITVRVAGNGRTVVAANPGANEVTADPLVGRLVFGAPLPAVGTVDTTYFLGQWEQRLAHIAGVLRIDVCAAQAADTATLATAATDVLLRPQAKRDIHRLLSLNLSALSSVGAPEQPLALRRRTARCAFSYEQEINEPESSGGVIGRIPVTTRLDVPTVDKTTGTVRSSVVTVPG